MIKLAFFLVKYLFSNKYRVIIAFSSKIDYLCFRVIQLCEVWGIRLIDFRNQFVTHPFLSLILQFVNQRDSLNGNNLFMTCGVWDRRCNSCAASVCFSFSSTSIGIATTGSPNRDERSTWRTVSLRISSILPIFSLHRSTRNCSRCCSWLFPAWARPVSVVSG